MWSGRTPSYRNIASLHFPTITHLTFWGDLTPGNERFIKRTRARPKARDNASPHSTCSTPLQDPALPETQGLTAAHLFGLTSLHAPPAYLAPATLVWVFVPETSQAHFCLKYFAFSPAWNASPSDFCMTASSSFKAYFKCHLLREALPDHSPSLRGKDTLLSPPLL